MKRRGTFFRSMNKREREAAGVDPIRLPNTLTPKMLARFHSLPLDRKENCLAALGRALREAEVLKLRASVSQFRKIHKDWSIEIKRIKTEKNCAD